MSPEQQNQLEQFNGDVAKWYRWNFTVSITDGAFFAFGNGFTALYTILTLFVLNLTSSKLLVSLVTTITMLFTYLPQILIANFVEGTRWKKPLVASIGIFQRLPWLGLALLVYFHDGNSTGWLLGGFFFFYALYCLAGGLNVPPWYDLTVKTIPPNKVGSYFGYRNFACGVTEFVGATIAGLILKTVAFPHNFAALFALTFLATGISFLFFIQIKEPDYPFVKQRLKLTDYLGSLPSILHKNRNFRLYIIALIFIQFYVMGNVLYTASAIELLGLSAAQAGLQVGIFTTLMLGAQTISFPFWGALSDRIGHRQIIAISAALNIGAVVAAMIGTQLYLFYIVFIFAGLSQGASRISLMAIIPEFCTPEDRPTFIGLTNSISGLAVIVASLAGGVIADLVNYRVAYLITGSLILMGLFVLIYRVADQRTVLRQTNVQQSV